MKFHNIHTAVQLSEDRLDLLKLRTAVMTSPVTIAAGTTPILIDGDAATDLIETLLRRNQAALTEIGVVEVPNWQPPKRPLERPE